MSSTQVTRFDLSQLKGMTPKLLRALEELLVDTKTNTDAVAGQVEATGSIQNATVITLSPNDAFNNERVLTEGQGIVLTDNGSGASLVIAMAYPITTVGGFSLTFNLPADTILNLPASGRIPSSEDGPYASDAAAAAAGVQIGEWYAKTGGNLAWRQV